MNQIIILDGNKVYLINDNGSAKWKFDIIEDAKELYTLLALSCKIEDRIDILVINSL